MLQEIWTGIERLLGLNVEQLEIGHMMVRAFVVFIAALVMVRLGEKRFFGKNTAFDVILGIIFGSVVSRAITGASDFFPALAAGLMLVLLHWLFAAIAFRSERFGSIIKGNSHILVKDGSIVWDAMRSSSISEKDLESSLRLKMNSDNLAAVEEARLERSGEISVKKASSQPRVTEITVADGVQTVRIQLE